MKKKIYYEKYENFCDLEYMTVEKYPMYDDPEHGPVYAMTYAEEIKIAAPLIIRHMVPLRGKEVFVLRSALGLTREEFAHALSVTSSSVFKWERAKTQRLSFANETVIRLFCSEKLMGNKPVNYSQLINVEDPPKPIVVKLKEAAA
jgi:DNA-binding transcriptional regulator YiaG